MGKKHYVTCLNCGRTFDASKGGYYNASKRRYLCPKCGRQNKREQKAASKEYTASKRERKTGMRQSYGALIAKVAAGGLFLVVSFTMDSFGEVCVGLILAAALIAWGLIPFFAAKKRQEEQRRKEATRKRICPYCGATTKGQTCEYCGSDLTEEA